MMSATSGSASANDSVNRFAASAWARDGSVMDVSRLLDGPPPGDSTPDPERQAMGAAMGRLPTYRGESAGAGLILPLRSMKKTPRHGTGARADKLKLRSQPVEDLIGPEPLETLQRPVQHRELVAVDATDLSDATQVLPVEHIDDVAHLASFIRELDAHGTAVDARALMIQVAHLDQLLEVIGDIGSEIVSACAQLAGREILLADVVQEQRLYGIDIVSAPAVELVLDHIEQPAMQSLDQRQGFEIVRTDLVNNCLTIDRPQCFRNASQHDTCSP